MTDGGGHGDERKVAPAKSAMDIASIVGGWFTAVGAIVAAVTLGAIAWQINETRNIQLESNARDGYRQFLHLGFQNPELYSGAAFATEDPRYPAFVSIALTACDDIFAAFEDDPAWLRGCAETIASHQAYLASDRFTDREYCTYAPPTRLEIDKYRRPQTECEAAPTSQE